MSRTAADVTRLCVTRVPFAFCKRCQRVMPFNVQPSAFGLLHISCPECGQTRKGDDLIFLTNTQASRIGWTITVEPVPAN